MSFDSLALPGSSARDKELPSLSTFSSDCRHPPFSSSLKCIDAILSMQDLPGKQVKFAGTGRQGLLHSLAYILLVIGCKQARHYPHLITLIREQFFKPGVFAELERGRRSRILNICRNIEIELISAGSVAQFCLTDEDFLFGFQFLLEKLLATGEAPSAAEAISQILTRRFNIDCAKVQGSETQCWVLGMQKRVYLFQEGQYYFVISSSTSTEPTKNVHDSTIQNRLESEREPSQLGPHVIVQASEQSTPKFKQNQESVRYRKKSHKNSFGGDFDITGYKELARLVNKSQYEDQQNPVTRPQVVPKKVFSEKFQVNQMACLTLEQQRQHNDLVTDGIESINGTNFNESTEKIKRNCQMRSSNIERGFAKNKNQRKKHITSSQIFDINKRVIRASITNSQADRVMQQEGAENNHQQFLNAQAPANLLNVGGRSDRETFKVSFSKKDAEKFVFKQIQSQYHEDAFPADQDLEMFKNFQVTKRQSLNLPEQSLRLLNEAQAESPFLRRGAQLQVPIGVIQEEMQSSQQERTEQRSISQSQKQGFEQFQLLQKNSSMSNNNKNAQVPWTSINNKNLINIFKSKNRKFSYLTQPISSNSKNSLFNNKNGQLRQSYMDEANQTILESPESNSNAEQHNQAGLSKDRRNHSKRKPPKIHKNSEAITQSKPKKKFQENPISFSQVFQTPEDWNFSGHSVRHKRPPQMAIDSNILQYFKDSIQCYDEPEGWTRKEVIYYFGEATPGNENIHNRSYRPPERFIIDRGINTSADAFLNQKSPKSIPYFILKNKPNQLSALSPKQVPTQPAPQPYALPSSQPQLQGNIRSTIDTATQANNRGGAAEGKARSRPVQMNSQKQLRNLIGANGQHRNTAMKSNNAELPFKFIESKINKANPQKATKLTETNLKCGNETFSALPVVTSQAVQSQKYITEAGWRPYPVRSPPKQISHNKVLATRTQSPQAHLQLQRNLNLGSPKHNPQNQVTQQTRPSFFAKEHRVMNNSFNSRGNPTEITLSRSRSPGHKKYSFNDTTVLVAEKMPVQPQPIKYLGSHVVSYRVL